MDFIKVQKNDVIRAFTMENQENTRVSPTFPYFGPPLAAALWERISLNKPPTPRRHVLFVDVPDARRTAPVRKRNRPAQARLEH